MYDKKKCKTCKYHSLDGYIGYEIASLKRIVCNYAAITNTTCLHRAENGKVEDRRGDDPLDCKLYEKGKRIIKKVKPREIRHKGASE